MESKASPLELTGYVGVVVASFILLTIKGVQLSDEFRQRQIVPGLKPGWMFENHKVDLSDPQWRSFRQNLALLTIVMLIFVAISSLIRRFVPERRQIFYVVFSLLYVGFLHGAHFGYLLILLVGNFYLSKICVGRSYGPVCIWIANLVLLWIVKDTKGVLFSFPNALAVLEGFKGPVRWHIGYNLTVLRMISFGMDYHWTITKKSTNKEQASTKNTTSCLDPNYYVKMRNNADLDPSSYNFINYFVYVFYPPLYLAGPISTFNNFVSQLQISRTLTKQQFIMKVFSNGVRFCCAFLLLETMTQFIYANSIAKYRLWEGPSPSLAVQLNALQFGVIGFWVLTFIWMKVQQLFDVLPFDVVFWKFLVIWSFSSLWSMADEIDPPENMCRCLYNNYDIEGFWKNWHASFNLWLVRYLYIPLGGQRYRWITIWIIFGFVAFWHDLEWKLLQWAWIMALFFAIEGAVKSLSRDRISSSFRNSTIYRHLSAVTAAANVFVLMTINMIGFGTGTKGTLFLFMEMIKNPFFVSIMLFTFYSGTQLMFWIRQKEDQLGYRIHFPFRGQA